MAGQTSRPLAISFTWIETDNLAELQERTQQIVTALASDPGFIGFRSMGVGDRFVTFTQWKSPEAAEAALARNAPHDDAMKRYWDGALGHRGFTSIWQPYKVNPQWAACPECSAYVRIDAGQPTVACECGGTVEVSTYL